MTDPQPSKTEKVKEEIKKEVSKIPATTDNNLLAAVSYVWLLSIVMLVIKKDDAFIQFHAKQGVILLIGSALGFIPVFGWIAWAGAIIGMVVGFMNAWQGKKYEIPFVYTLSKKINL
jgi:uncharacterized membrane protein